MRCGDQRKRHCSIAVPALSFEADAICNANSFIVKRIGTTGRCQGSADSAIAGRVFEFGPRPVPGPTCGLVASRSLTTRGDPSETPMPFPYLFPVRRPKALPHAQYMPSIPDCCPRRNIRYNRYVPFLLTDLNM
jgi:hypothetical protein